MFTALSATGGYAVELVRREKGKESEKVFDSRKLQAGDLFIVHVMRPGTYSIKNLNGKGQTELTVEYPDAEKLKMKADPFLVEFDGEEIVPSKINVQPVQALMFNPKGESRITIELKKADDRPAMVRAPIVTPAKARKKKAPAAAGQETGPPADQVLWLSLRRGFRHLDPGPGKVRASQFFSDPAIRPSH